MKYDFATIADAENGSLEFAVVRETDLAMGRDIGQFRAAAKIGDADPETAAGDGPGCVAWKCMEFLMTAPEFGSTRPIRSSRFPPAYGRSPSDEIEAAP